MPAEAVPPSALPGWDADDHGAALQAYAVTAHILPPPWPRPVAADLDDPRGFFERGFRAVVLGSPPALLTGYYEPELDGRPSPAPGFGHPLYSRPAGLAPGELWYDRTAIESGGLLDGHEVVWLSNPVDAFFAQVQGSVRVRLPGGRVLRLGHDGKNGHPYRSIGAELVRRGEIAADAISAQTIRDWCALHPGDVATLFRHNPSFCFFRLLDLPASAGPLGTLGRSVTPGRSLAVDPAHHPMGAPVWVEVEGVRAMRRLMVAQDTGSAIKSAQRGDIFVGSGAWAGKLAGEMKDAGRIVTLLPLRGLDP